ncbi:vigilin [Nephila pilipes]|uniref:Vigilin n=1 Tax=Nephila pilipes TaxID=299642 RepID=A0A8X6PFG0_NEPPI|nr:vigilin [Nephila pilipes]
MPPPDVQSDNITLKGEQDKLCPALTLVYYKIKNVKTEHMDVRSWLNNYIIDKKVANIQHMTQDFSKVQVDFIDESVKSEGGPEEIYKT